MEPTLPLRNKVRFKRRTTHRDGAGGHETSFATVADRKCTLKPTRGGEEVIAGRLTGVSVWDLWVRYDGVTKTITPGDCLEELIGDGAGREFNIKFTQDMTGNRRWLLMQCELGPPVG